MKPRWATAAFFLLGVALGLPSLGLGLWSDDWGQGLFLQKILSGSGAQRPWWELYTLAEGDSRQVFSGVLPWWSTPNLRIAFFRPLGAATHVLDYALWPRAFWAMHLHSALWFGGCCAAAWVLLERILPRPVAWVAAGLFAVAYVHASPIAWIAQRNALVSTMFALLALSAGAAFLRDGRWRALVGALTALTASMLGSEGGAVAAVALGAMVLLGLGPRRRGIILGVTTLCTLAAWRLAYHALDYGAFGSGTYVDPLRDPGVFVRLAPLRALELAALHLIPHRMLPFELGHWPGFALGVVLVGALAWWSVSNWANPSVRYAATVFVVSCGVLSVGEPHERLLSFSALFSSMLVTRALTAKHTGLRVFTLAAFGVLHLFMLQWSLPRHEMRQPAPADEVSVVLESAAALPNATLVLIDPPDYRHVHALQRALMERRLPWPRWWLVLVTGDAEVSREGCCTLQVSAPHGAFGDAAAHLFSPRPGEASFEGLWFSATPASDGRAFTFEWKSSLDAPHLLLLTWRDGRWVRLAS